MNDPTHMPYPRVETAQHRPKQANELWRGTKRAAIKMRLPLAPRERLLQGLLLLTLMLVTVCGTLMEKNQSAETQPKTPIQEMQVSCGVPVGQWIVLGSIAELSTVFERGFSRVQSGC